MKKEERISLNEDEELRARIHAMSDEAISKELEKKQASIGLSTRRIKRLKEGNLDLDSGETIYVGVDVVGIRRCEERIEDASRDLELLYSEQKSRGGQI